MVMDKLLKKLFNIPEEKYENIFKGAYNRNITYVKNKTKKYKKINYFIYSIKSTKYSIFNLFKI